MDEYRSSFSSMVKMSPEYARNVRLEILVALSDPDWSWVKEAEEEEAPNL
ncbi:MAG: hypothetical protein GY941_10245 [Planctomycetes bacterium]|nr:hypothetical protein [Planctomycetota bacterium]